MNYNLETLRKDFCKAANESFLSYVTDGLMMTELADMLIEECAELVQALCKLKRLGGKNPTPISKADVMANLKEELADVKVAAMALLYALSQSGNATSNEIETIVSEKIDRWVSRLRATEDDND